MIQILVTCPSDYTRSINLLNALSLSGTVISTHNNSSTEYIFANTNNDEPSKLKPGSLIVFNSNPTLSLYFRSFCFFLDRLNLLIERRFGTSLFKLSLAFLISGINKLFPTSSANTIFTSRGLDLDAFFPSFQMICSGSYIAQTSFDARIVSRYGINVLTRVGYYNHNILQSTRDFQPNILIMPT